MTRVNRQDETLIARYLDGEMSDVDRAGFDARLQKDADLRAAMHAEEGSSRALRDGWPPPLKAPANFRTAVLDKVRRMPSRDELVKITTSEENIVAVVAYGRRLLVAAAVILGLGLLFGFKLLHSDEGSQLQALDDKKLMDQLDVKVKKILEERLRLK